MSNVSQNNLQGNDKTWLRTDLGGARQSLGALAPLWIAIDYHCHQRKGA